MWTWNWCKLHVKPGLYASVFATSWKRRDNFAAAFSVAAWAEDVSGFGKSKKPANDIDAEESEKVPNCQTFSLSPRKTLPFLSNQLACLRSHDVPLLFGTFHESVWWKSLVPASWVSMKSWWLKWGVFPPVWLRGDYTSRLGIFIL